MRRCLLPALFAALFFPLHAFGATDQPNAADMYKKAFDLVAQEPAFAEIQKLKRNCVLDAPTQALLARCVPAFDLVAQGERIAKCDWRIDYADPRLKLAYVVQAPRFVTAARHQVRLFCELKQYDQAVVLTKATLLAGRRLANIKLIDSRRTGAGIEQATIDVITDYLPDMPPTALSELLRSETALPPVDPVADTLRSEAHNLIANMRKGDVVPTKPDDAAAFKGDKEHSLAALDLAYQEESKVMSAPTIQLPPTKAKLQQIRSTVPPCVAQFYFDCRENLIDEECQWLVMRTEYHVAIGVALGGESMLSSGLDPFSSKPFNYEKLPHGFRLSGLYALPDQSPLTMTVGHYSASASPTSLPSALPNAVAGAWDSSLALVQARGSYVTKLLYPPPAANNHQAPDNVPEYRLGRYTAPRGKCWAYLSPDPKDGGAHPAMIWVHDGYGGIDGSIAATQPADDDQTPRAFRDAGFVVMIPSFRGENDNPGDVEMFYGEVDDILCALESLTHVPYVDPTRIYMAGHGAGGTIALLAAESTTKLRAAFDIGGRVEVRQMVRGADHHHCPFDYENPREADLRSAIDFVKDLKTPTWFFDGDEGALGAWALAMDRNARRAKSPFQAFVLKGGAGHFNVTRPITRLLTTKLLADTDATCNITIAPQEVADAFNHEFQAKKPVTCLTAASPEIVLTPRLQQWAAGVVTANKFDPKKGYIHIFKPEKNVLVLAVQSGEQPGYFTQSPGIGCLIDDEIAADLGPTVIDIEDTPKGSFFLMIPNGLPRAVGKKVLLWGSHDGAPNGQPNHR